MGNCLHHFQSHLQWIFFIPVRYVFDYFIHSKRRKIYLRKSIQTLHNNTSYHDYSVSGSASQLCSDTSLKFSCLFSSILIHHKKFPKQSVLNQYRTHRLPATKYKLKLLHGLTCLPVHQCPWLHWCANKGIEQAYSYKYISLFSINLHFSL